MNGHYKPDDVVLGNWTLKQLIGEGSFGRVFSAEREDFGTVYKSAIKIITIPQSQAEVKSARAEGMDDESVRAYFRSFVEEMVREFALMSKLRGTANIVSYEDHTVESHTAGIGWDIIIRMELLTTLIDHAQKNTLTRKDVTQLGIDICKALEICQKYNVVHRDIKPENIFLSEIGDFKLGDFGIARTVEKTTSGLSKKGTYSYMAPEVYRGDAYGTNVDLYSLGIVLYRLLNDNRTPFLPDYPEPITHNARERALAKRLSGAGMPMPKNADGRLAEIVLKACAYNPKDRYSFPKQMREELEAILYNRAEASLIYPKGDAAPIKSADYAQAHISNAVKPDAPEKEATESLFSETSMPEGAKRISAKTVSKAEGVFGENADEKTEGIFDETAKRKTESALGGSAGAHKPRHAFPAYDSGTKMPQKPTPKKSKAPVALLVSLVVVLLWVLIPQLGNACQNTPQITPYAPPTTPYAPQINDSSGDSTNLEQPGNDSPTDAYIEDDQGETQPVELLVLPDTARWLPDGYSFIIVITVQAIRTGDTRIYFGSAMHFKPLIEIRDSQGRSVNADFYFRQDWEQDGAEYGAEFGISAVFEISPDRIKKIDDTTYTVEGFINGETYFVSASVDSSGLHYILDDDSLSADSSGIRYVSDEHSFTYYDYNTDELLLYTSWRDGNELVAYSGFADGGNATDSQLASMVSSGEIPSNIGVLWLSSRSRGISDITPLQTLTDLQVLGLRNTSVNSLEPLRALTNLKELDLMNTPIGDLTPLQPLTALERLTLGDTRSISSISDLEPLRSLVNLTYLSIMRCNADDWTPLQSLTNLERLYLVDSEIDDIAWLTTLTNLKHLDLSGTGLTESQIQEIREALPDCVVN